MMTDNEFDNLFKDTFSRHEMQVPADMWQRISDKSNKRRRGAYYWKWSALLLLLIAATGIVVYTTQSTNKNIKETSVNKSKENTNVQEPNVAQGTTKSSAEKITAQSDQNMIDLGDQDIIPRLSNENKQTVKSPSNHQSNHSEQTGAASDNLMHADEQTQHVSAESNVANSTTIIPGIVNNSTKDNAAQSNSTVTKQPDKAVAKEHERQPFILEIFGGFAYADKQTYNITGASSTQENTNKNKPAGETYTAGIRFGLPITKHITAKTGLHFLQTYQRAIANQKTVNNFSIINTEPGSGGTMIPDTMRYAQVSYYSSKVKSVTTGVSIPLLFTYETGKKIKTGVTAGAVVNVYSWHKGQIPYSGNIGTLEADKTYKHNIGTSLYASVSAAKKIGNIQLFAEPYLQYNLSSQTKQTVSFSQKVNNYGINIGIRKTLDTKK